MMQRDAADPRDQSVRPFDLVRRLGLRPDATVADVGAGRAYFTLHLAAAVPKGSVIATDTQSVALGIVARRARAAGLANVETRAGDRDHCRLEPSSIDLAFLCQVDHHLGNRVAYLRTVVEALRSDGRIAIVNAGRRLRANQAAARELSLVTVDEWWPSSDYFLLVLQRAK
jgi:precorrin-6B methylase 2